MPGQEGEGVWSINMLGIGLLSFLLVCSLSLQFLVKKEGFGGGGTRNLHFHQGQTEYAMLKASGKTLNISIAPGLPSSTRKLT